MIESPIRDRLSSFDNVSGSSILSFKLPGCKEPRADIPTWKINRTNARSAGRKTFLHTTPCHICGSLVRLTHKTYKGTGRNKCAGCLV